MSLCNSQVVDAAGIESTSGFAVLTIADSWDWSDEHSHLIALQGKLNSYFAFIESGEVWEAYPKAKGKQIVIDIVGRFPIPESANAFLVKASEVAGELHVVIRCKLDE